MVHHHGHTGRLVPQETNFDNADNPGIAQPYSQSEIEDLLYGDDRPLAERVARLKEIRSEALARESGDFGDEDPAAMLDELDRAIEALEGDAANLDETGDAAALMSADPADHLDALSPDDVDARQVLTGEDDLDEDEWPEDDDNVWQGSEEFKPGLN
ncbi:hypothetical protein [Devosia faecipullorum]|uniref:hypothetical protein n=1 Tax=Devosia faecipullorum TaxID=2755039 RepID=UPI00187B1CC4|nr:hypothetical protein [Devosia faecipullorum]MBE7734186.1 hypothetical protein [Devosia faecipullorum]